MSYVQCMVNGLRQGHYTLDYVQNGKRLKCVVLRTYSLEQPKSPFHPRKKDIYKVFSLQTYFLYDRRFV